MRILVVEDDIGTARLLSKIVERWGHEVAIATSGRAGLVRARSFQPAAIISDIGMPDLNGYEMAKQLRQEPKFKDTLLIALTAYGQPSDVGEAMAAGFDHHFTKPCDFDRMQILLNSREPA